MAVDTLTIGKAKIQTPVTDVSEKDLQWYATKCTSAKLQKIARDELARRAGGKRSAPAAQASQAVARTAPTSALAIEGSFADPKRATAALKQAADDFHLVTPSTMVGSLPEGCSIALALVHIHPDDTHLYKVGDKYALDKTHLASIANAVGASTVFSRRTDDGSDPHYCAWTVKVRYRQFDGTFLERQGSVEMDLREPHGAEYVDCVRKAEKADRDPAAQLGELRRFISRHAESKALNRAYSALGIRRSYTRGELERPFCVARVTFTGQSEDPEARRQFREGIMASFLGSSHAAFGPGESRGEQLHPPPPQHEPTTYETEGEEYEGEVPPEAAPAQERPFTAEREAAPENADGGDMDRGPDPEQY